MPMSAEEVIEAIARHEDAAHHLTTEELAPHAERRRTAEARIRLAFAVLEEAECRAAEVVAAKMREPILCEGQKIAADEK
jgi:hypothetical protein